MECCLCNKLYKKIADYSFCKIKRCLYSLILTLNKALLDSQHISHSVTPGFAYYPFCSENCA